MKFIIGILIFAAVGCSNFERKPAAVERPQVGLQEELISTEAFFGLYIVLTPRSDKAIEISKRVKKQIDPVKNNAKGGGAYWGKPPEFENFPYSPKSCIVTNLATGDESKDEPLGINLKSAIASTCILRLGDLHEYNSNGQERKFFLDCKIPDKENEGQLKPVRINMESTGGGVKLIKDGPYPEHTPLCN